MRNIQNSWLPVNLVLFVLLLAVGSVYAEKLDRQGKQKATNSMDNQRLDRLIRKIDPQAKGEKGYWQLHVDNKQLLVITDEKADRMRIISPVAKSADLDQKQLYRIMQANFDSALDARYAIAKQTLWSAFIHPLSSLNDHDFLSGLGQVANLVNSYGGSFSSGALIFQGGDSKDLQPRKLIDELLEKGLEV